MSKTILIDQFWNAVIAQDYKTIRKAIADGFDVNAEMPGKVAPIIFAQPAKDMIILKMLWEAGAYPATSWLEAVFADFAIGGNGSKYKSKKLKPVGKFILHRFNGDEEFTLEHAVIRINHYQDKMLLLFEADTNGKVIKTLPDTRELPSKPNARISIPISNSDLKNLVGKKFNLPLSYNEQIDDYDAAIYYLEHEPLNENEIEFVSKRKDKYFIKWVGKTTDVNYYDKSEPDTRVEIVGWFALIL